MEAISAQWPLLGVSLIFCAALLRVVQAQYERMLTEKQALIDKLTGELAEQGDALKELTALQRQQVEWQRTQQPPRRGAASGGA